MILIRWLAGVMALLALLLTGPAAVWWLGGIDTRTGWASAGRASVGLAPRAEDFSEAVVQLYGARAFNWRGAFAMHTWIAVKPAGESIYTTHEVQGWRQPTVRTRQGAPDREWFGQRPQLLADLRRPSCISNRPWVIIPDRIAIASFPAPTAIRSSPG